MGSSRWDHLIKPLGSPDIQQTDPELLYPYVGEEFSPSTTQEEVLQEPRQS